MGKPLILVIDQDEERIKALSEVLSEYTIFVVSTGQEALNTYKKNYLKIRLVLLHTVLSDMSGIELLRQLKDLSVVPEVIVLSDRQDVGLAVNAMKEGAFDYLPIPLNYVQLLHSVEQAISQLDYSEKIHKLSNPSYSFPSSLDQTLSVSEEVIFQRKLIEKSICTGDIMNMFTFSKCQIPLELEEFRVQVSQKLDELLKRLPAPNVLIVEGEEGSLMKMSEFLSDRYQIHSAFSGVKALSLMESISQIDIVLLDIFLPDCSGIELVSQMKQIQPNAEIIVITAFELIDKAVLAIRNGACDYLNKPILKEDLRLAVECALERKYINYILPEFRKQFVQSYLSEESKFNILEKLYEERQKNDESIFMRDIYMFFPELREVSMPESVTLPCRIFQEGIRNFILELKEKSQQYSLGLNVSRRDEE
jgi:DNA-binding NtrC family response regulator